MNLLQGKMFYCPRLLLICNTSTAHQGATAHTLANWINQLINRKYTILIID